MFLWLKTYLTTGVEFYHMTLNNIYELYTYPNVKTCTRNYYHVLETISTEMFEQKNIYSVMLWGHCSCFSKHCLISVGLVLNTHIYWYFNSPSILQKIYVSYKFSDFSASGGNVFFMSRMYFTGYCLQYKRKLSFIPGISICTGKLSGRPCTLPYTTEQVLGEKIITYGQNIPWTPLHFCSWSWQIGTQQIPDHLVSSRKQYYIQILDLFSLLYYARPQFLDESYWLMI